MSSDFFATLTQRRGKEEVKKGRKGKGGDDSRRVGTRKDAEVDARIAEEEGSVSGNSDARHSDSGKTSVRRKPRRRGAPLGSTAVEVGTKIETADLPRKKRRRRAGARREKVASAVEVDSRGSMRMGAESGSSSHDADAPADVEAMSFGWGNGKVSVDGDAARPPDGSAAETAGGSTPTAGGSVSFAEKGRRTDTSFGKSRGRGVLTTDEMLGALGDVPADQHVSFLQKLVQEAGTDTNRVKTVTSSRPRPVRRRNTRRDRRGREHDRRRDPEHEEDPSSSNGGVGVTIPKKTRLKRTSLAETSTSERTSTQTDDSTTEEPDFPVSKEAVPIVKVTRTKPAGDERWDQSGNYVSFPKSMALRQWDKIMRSLAIKGVRRNPTLAWDVWKWKVQTQTLVGTSGNGRCRRW